MYIQPHAQRHQDALGKLEELRRQGSQGAAQRDLLPAIRHGNPATGTCGPPQPESFRGGGPGHPGALEKETLTPCAVHTATHDSVMSKTVRNAEGLYLNPSQAFGQPLWGAPQWACCFDTEEQAAAAARYFDGEVADVPRFDEKAKVWR